MDENKKDEPFQRLKEKVKTAAPGRLLQELNVSLLSGNTIQDDRIYTICEAIIERYPIIVDRRLIMEKALNQYGKSSSNVLEMDISEEQLEEYLVGLAVGIVSILDFIKKRQEKKP